MCSSCTRGEPTLLTQSERFLAIRGGVVNGGFTYSARMGLTL
jgi:hypothetical protein